jgi:secreted trypsin-like serine protease
MSIAHPAFRPRLLLAGGLLTAIICVLLWEASPATAIVGGYRPDRSQWPWLVAVERHSGGLAPRGPTASSRKGKKCGGALIDRWVVLTAAHCVVGGDGRRPAARKLSVVVGADDLTNGEGHEVRVDRVETYRGFDRRHPQGDVALLRLVRPQPQDAAIFMNTQSVIHQGNVLTTMGWGAIGVTTGGRLVFPAQRLAVDVPVWTDRECARFLGKRYDPATMLCAGYAAGGHDPCYGDSGSPLMIWLDEQWQLVGVVSYGDGCGRPNSPGVYAWVSGSRLYGWISRAATELIRNVASPRTVAPATDGARAGRTRDATARSGVRSTQ